MYYIIDGYNLMFRVLRAGDDLSEQRHQFIDQISEKIELLQLDATIVFDAQFQPENAEITHVKGLAILFTNHGQIADDLICQLVKRNENPRNCTVVTSDNRLAWRTRIHGAKTESVEEFFGWLNKRYQNRIKRSQPKKKSQETEQLLKPSTRDLEEVFEDPSQLEGIMTDFDRWLKIFEQRTKKQDNDKI